MSTINIKAFFKFSKVKVVKQILDIQSKTVSVKVEPQKRYAPVCHVCNTHSNSIHSYHERTVRDLNILEAKTYIQYSYRKIRCCRCGIVVEGLKLVKPDLRITRRLANYILELCGILILRLLKNLFPRHL